MAVIYFGFNSFLQHKRGVENVILNQSSVFKGRKYYVSFGEKYSKYRYNDITCFSIKNNVFFPLVLNFLVCYLNIINERLGVHSHNYLFSFFLIQKLNVVTVHDGLVYQSVSVEPNVGVVKKRVLAFIERRVYKKASKIHIISDYTYRQCLLENTDSSKIVKIYNTVPFELEKKKYALSTEGRPEFYDMKKTNVLIVRSIEERAALPLIFSASKQLPSFNFVICGKGPLLEFYQRLLQKEQIPNVRLLGYVPDECLGECYSFADIVMVPALYGEGFGLPVIEGYLFGKPVFASNVCAIPEVIFSEDYLFDNCVEDITSKLNNYSDIDSTSDYYSHYHSKFGLEVYSKKMVKLYEELGFV